MKIDLHVHAKERSGCSVSGEQEIIASARARGLDALAFTDHERLVPASRLAELNRLNAPFRIFSGIELHTAEEEDVLVFGIQDPRIESMHWPYEDLYRFVRERSGFMALAHPFRYRDTINVDLRKFRPDAIEARSTNVPEHAVARIIRTAGDLGCATLYASDAHRAEDVGSFHVCLSSAADSDFALVSLLRSRTYACCALSD